eukprot:5012019-Prymnesium_polylepis.1
MAISTKAGETTIRCSAAVCSSLPALTDCRCCALVLGAHQLERHHLTTGLHLSDSIPLAFHVHLERLLE